MRYTKHLALFLIVSAPLAYFFIGTDSSASSESLNVISKNAGESLQKERHEIPPMLQRLPNTMQVKGDKSEFRSTESIDYNHPIDRIKAIQVKTALHQSILQDHQQYRRYPSSNIAISQGSRDPITMRYEIDERTTENQDRTAFLTIWTDKKFYQRGDEVQLSAKLLDIHGAPIISKFSAQLIYDESKSLMVLDLQDSDRDGIHQVRFQTNHSQGQNMPAGNYKLLVVNSVDQVADAAVFTISDPVAEFTGEYRDSISKEGNLMIEAEIEVIEKEKLYFQASLYTELGEAIGLTQNTFTFNPGKHWVPLEFYGLMLHDSGVDGPYLLKNISLARVTMPMQRGPLQNPEYYTQAYERNQFSSKTHDSLAAR